MRKFFLIKFLKTKIILLLKMQIYSLYNTHIDCGETKNDFKKLFSVTLNSGIHEKIIVSQNSKNKSQT